MSKPTGLLAGWGRFPILVARALKRQGREVVCLGVRNHASEELAEICDHFRWIGIAKLGGQVRYLRRHGVHTATMAGKLFKHKLIYGGHWIRHLPDLYCVQTLFPHFITKRKDMQDDTLMKTAIDAYASAGITLVPPTDSAPDLLARPGQFTRRAPSSSEQLDIAFGWQVAKEMGRMDIGQSVAVKNQAVLAVEAIEGTDECIRRAGSLCKQGGFTFVKVAKPQQDMRFDVPTIGPGTIGQLIDAKASCLAIEAARTIIVDESEVIEMANQHRLAIVSLDDTEHPTMPLAGTKLDSADAAH